MWSNAAAVREAISDALAAVGSRSRDVIVVVPDAAVRIVLLDFEELPERRQDADSVVRFRLKKSLPFEVDDAALSYDVRRSSTRARAAKWRHQGDRRRRSRRHARGIRIAVPRCRLQSRRGAALDAGLARRGGSRCRPRWRSRSTCNSTSVAIVQGEDLLLYRTLENAHGDRLDAAALADDIYSSLVFFQDNYGMKVERILLGGLASAQEIGAALEAQTGARVERSRLRIAGWRARDAGAVA